MLNAAGFDDQNVGVAFFVSPTRLVTAQHTLDVHYCGHTEGSVVRIGVHTVEEEVCFQDAYLVRSHFGWDSAVLTIEGSHHSHLILPTQPVSGRGHKVAITSFTSDLANLIPNAVYYNFCLIPGSLLNINGHHVVYSSQLFSGDSGGAVILSADGTTVSLHLESVSQAVELARIGGIEGEDDEEEEKDLTFKTTRKISKSLNSLVSGLSQGFIGLRLDCPDVQEFIFH